LIKGIFPRYDHKLNVAVNIFLALLLVLPALISSYPVFAEPVLAPSVVSAATNVAATIITITFNKNMANPGIKIAEFRYKLNGGSAQSFSVAALNADNAKIDLTCAGTAIAFGDIVTLNYALIPSLGYVFSADGGALADFSDQAVTNNVLSPDKAIAAFNIPGQVGLTAINEGTHTIALTMPYGTDVTALVPSIIIMGESVNPANGVANNFTTPQTYTVTAADSSTQAYTVTVTVASPPPNPLIGTGTPTSYGSSVTGTVTTAQTISLPIIQTQGANPSSFIVTPGTPVTVTADIANKGTVNGTKKVTLYVNGQVESTQGVKVNSGSSSKLIFSFTHSEPGVYSVYVDGVSAGRSKVDDFA